MEEEYDPRNPMPELKENAVAEYFAVESKYMASPDYMQSNKRFLRRRALQLVFINSKSADFDPVVPYLAMNYYDRFITSNPLPVVDNDLRSSFDLLVICCLTLAWKMREQTFSLPDFLVDLQALIIPHYYLESNLKTSNINVANVLEMESRILDGLGGLMNAVTPFCFVDYLLSKVEAPINLRLIDDIILEAQARVEFSQFKPSVIAGAAIVMAALIRHTQEFPPTQRSLYAVDKLERRELDSCFRYVSALYSDHKIGSEDEAFMALSSNKQQQERTSIVGKKKKSSRKGKKQQTPRGKGKGVLEAIKEETGDEMYTELKWLTEREEINEVTNDPNLLLQFVAPTPPPPAGDNQENA